MPFLYYSAAVVNHKPSYGALTRNFISSTGVAGAESKSIFTQFWDENILDYCIFNDYILLNPILGVFLLITRFRSETCQKGLPLFCTLQFPPQL